MSPMLLLLSLIPSQLPDVPLRVNVTLLELVPFTSSVPLMMSCTPGSNLMVVPASIASVLPDGMVKSSVITTSP